MMDPKRLAEIEEAFSLWPAARACVEWEEVAQELLAEVHRLRAERDAIVAVVRKREEGRRLQLKQYSPEPRDANVSAHLCVSLKWSEARAVLDEVERELAKGGGK